MAGEDHPFSRLTAGQAHHDRMTARAGIAFEEGKVSYLLGVFKLNIRKVGNELRQIEEAERGQPNLTFRAFHSAYPTFPLVLGTDRLAGAALHLNPKAMIPSLFKEFSQAPFVTAYDAFYEKNAGRASGRPLGLVFPRKGFKQGMLIHAAETPTDLPLCAKESLLCYVGGTKKHRHWLVVRSFARVLEAVHNGGHGWRPDNR